MNDSSNGGWVIDGLPVDGQWVDGCGCPPSTGVTSTVDNITITGSPGTITSVQNSQALWTLVLNDGTPQADFALQRYDSSGLLIDAPITAERATGIVTFHDPVMLARDPVEPMEAVTLEYLEVHGAGVAEAPEDGQLYGRQNADWTVIPPSPIASDAPNDGAAYVRQSLAWTPLSAQLTGFMPISGGTFTGVVTFQANNSVGIIGAAGSQRAILGGTAGPPISYRWQMMLGDQAPESGGNAGSNFVLNAISDGGGLMPASALSISRATNAATFGGTIIAPGNVGGDASSIIINKGTSQNAAIAGQTNGSQRWLLSLADPTGELGSNFGSNFRINRYSDAGVLIDASVLISRQTGVATFSQLPSFPGGIVNYVLATNGSGTLAWAPPGIGDAPNNGQQYARQNNAWSVVVSGGGGIPEAPTDGRIYGRRGSDTSWQVAASGPPVTISDTAPSSPAVGALWWDSVGGQLYVWYSDPNTSQWVAASNAASQPPPASTTVLGSVKVDGTSIHAAADGTISTVLVPMGDNRIINGDMRIDQRNSGNPGAASNVYTVDRWAYAASQVTKGTWQRVGGAPSGFGYSLIFTSSSAYASVAADYFALQQPIEADMVVDFAWGTAGAQPVTLSFWVETSQSGTFSGSIRNTAQTRSYPFSFNVSVAGTWVKVAITIPGDTGGSWTLTGNGEALRVCFDLGSGSSNRGPANTWATTTAPGYLGVTGAISTVATNGAYFVVTGVKLEIGSTATSFNRQSLTKSLADCQRYYLAGQLYGTFPTVAAGGPVAVSTSMIVSMRATPTLTATTNGNVNAGSFVVNSVVGNNMIYGTATATATGTVTINWGFSASAEL